VKRLLNTAAVLACAFTLVLGSAQAQDNIQAEVSNAIAALRATVENLRAEVVLLRTDLLKLELARHHDNIRQIKTEIDKVRAENAQLTEFDRGGQQDLRDMEDLLARGEISVAERTDMELTRGELAVGQSREITQQSEAARIRENDLIRRLATEEQAAKRLSEVRKATREKLQ
jgi:hypothetical protein